MSTGEEADFDSHEPLEQHADDDLMPTQQRVRELCSAVDSTVEAFGGSAGEPMEVDVSNYDPTYKTLELFHSPAGERGGAGIAIASAKVDGVPHLGSSGKKYIRHEPVWRVTRLWNDPRNGAGITLEIHAMRSADDTSEPEDIIHESMTLTGAQLEQPDPHLHGDIAAVEQLLPQVVSDRRNTTE